MSETGAGAFYADVQDSQTRISYPVPREALGLRKMS